MKILHVITGLGVGGAERTLYNLLENGLAKRHEIYVLSLTNEGVYGSRIRELGVHVSALNMARSLTVISVIWRLRKLVRKVRPDLIQGWMYHGNLIASLARRFAIDFPSLVWNVRHSLYDLALEKPLTRQVIRISRWLSRGTDVIIYNSQISREQHESFGLDRTKGQVIPNGFDLEILKPDINVKFIIRKELDIKEDAILIGHVARFHPMKDHVSFLHAAVQVASINPAVRFLVVGRGVSSDNTGLINIVPPEMSENFIFLGERSDIYRLMQAMDIFCQSSWSEAFPNVLGEAMACGVPCVATDVGDSSEIIGETGLLVPPRNSNALAIGILRMLELPVERRLELGRLARDRVKCRYGLEFMTNQYVTLYDALIKG